ncbi:ion channel [Silvimonas amylolytica]|uniref:Inward rectifier potassium channel protein n=1 Tax=Silvimonas amylolytica TaxID=449663 RepID=A0ABQ2PSA4_9NEIS|nr:ion channel [Silvimonas amylolytica]GGP28271.1 inward rectifier potassium channel protein [Silvimonas amylolytica]
MFELHLPKSNNVALLGDREIITHGLQTQIWSDLYHRCMMMRWPVFFLLVGIAFLLLNLIFATFYCAGLHPIANQYPAGFWGAFFFSVETIATVGYGDMHPQSVYGHIIATVEIFTGMMSIALITGVMFARFSRPHARIMFSHNPVIRPVDGQMMLMMRAANARQNVIVDASARLRLIRQESSVEGLQIRRIHDLGLVRQQHPMFVLSWTLMHVIDQSSPLFGMTAADLARTDSMLVLSLDGTDETTTQTMRSRQSYDHMLIRWQYAYADLLYTDEHGQTHVDYSRMNEIRPLVVTEQPTG